jgi:hypothetical protein
MYFGVSQILSQTKIVRIGLSYTQSEGYLTDPYKFADRRPDTHDKWTLSAGYRQFMVNMDAALQADYRYYHDDWGTDSHTIEIGWHQNLGKHVLAPYLRYYTQEEADFFSPIADRSQPFYADDYRLSSYGALTAGVRWTVQLGDWGIEAQAERYRSNNDWGLFDGDAAPALVDFWRATVGLSWRFD